MCVERAVTLVAQRQPCVQAFTRMVKVWKQGCVGQSWCMGYERRWVILRLCSHKNTPIFTCSGCSAFLINLCLEPSINYVFMRHAPKGIYQRGRDPSLGNTSPNGIKPDELLDLLFPLSRSRSCSVVTALNPSFSEVQGAAPLHRGYTLFNSLPSLQPAFLGRSVLMLTF